MTTKTKENDAFVNINVPKAPERFYQRFNALGGNEFPEAPRITTDDSEGLFPLRNKGLKVLMINAPIREWSYPNIFPLGQAYVCSVAAMDGHYVETLDLNALRKEPMDKTPEEMSKWVEAKIDEKFNHYHPDVIMIGGIIPQYARIKQITTYCKKVFPEIPIVLGGGISSCMPEFMVKMLPIDIAVNKEGEMTTSELLHRLEEGVSLEGCAGVVYKHEIKKGEWEIRNNGERTGFKTRWDGLDTLPWPLRSRFAIDEIYKQNPLGHLNWENKWSDGKSTCDTYSVELLASRGCPYAAKACDYCYASYLGKTYRLRSPQEIVDEMQYLHDRYDAGYMHFLDDLLFTDYRWAMEFCEALKNQRKKTGLDVTWGGACRTNIIADDVVRAKKQGRPNILELGREVGMRQAGYGVETASPTILKSIDKSGQTQEKIKIAVRETQRVLGYADCSFMIGSPGETRQTVAETVEVCKEIGLKPEVFFFVTAYPGTSFWDLAMEKGLITKAVTGVVAPADDDMVEQYFLRLGEQGDAVRTNFSDLPDEEIVELSWWAINELGAQNTKRHPGRKDKETAVRGASTANL